MLETRLNSILNYDSYTTYKFLRVYRFKCSSLVMRFFFPQYIHNFSYFPQKWVQFCQHWYAFQHWDIYLIHIEIIRNIFKKRTIEIDRLNQRNN